MESSGSEPNPFQCRVEELEAQVQALTRENQDLSIVLATTTEHGDMIESLLSDTNLKLKAEIAERQRAQVKLQCLLDLISRQKSDLEIIMNTVMEHGDVLDAQWREKLGLTVELANLDPLTQCYNRRRFDAYLAEQWSMQAQEEGSIALILCDIDHFKQYNDFYGHLTGDDCLRRVAQALSASLRNPLDLFCRYGGEEFVAILPCTDLMGAELCAGRMQASVASLDIRHHPSPISDCVTMSFGVAVCKPVHDSDPCQLIAEADACLYRAKAEGRNTIIASPSVMTSSDPAIS
jgi:diguanylate cyclase (GGDEF)-like protein